MRKMKGMAFVGLVTASLLGAAFAPRIVMAQTAATPAEAPAPTPAPAFDKTAKSQAIAAAVKLLTDAYVFPDVGAKAAAMLTQNLDAGKYDSAATPNDFATQATQDLQDLTHDKHLRVMNFGPPPAPPASDSTASKGPKSPPPPPGNIGFVKVARLKGNIGYIQLDAFMPRNAFRYGADPAMALVASTDALIIDVRNNTGGDPAGVTYLDSFFFDSKAPVHVEDIVWRTEGTHDFTTQSFMTEPTPVSYLDKPVYVIAGGETFSGGEAFAYEMQAEKRATVVGQVTMGGANPGQMNPIGSDLFLFVPTGRGDNPVTHGNWDGKGVQPDIAVEPDATFATAYGAALHDLGRPATATDVSLDTVTDAQLVINTRTQPLPDSEARLRQWIAGMADGHPPEDIFTADGAVEAAKVVSFLQKDIGRRGALKSLVFAEAGSNGGDVYDATFADDSSVQFTLFLTPDGKIDTVIGQPY